MPHQRRNPLNGEWVIVSPHRICRPWGGEASKPKQGGGFTKTQSYLSPGATRTNGETNPDYSSTYVFPNDFPALISNHGNSGKTEETTASEEDDLFVRSGAEGECHVMCFTPDSQLSLPLMTLSDIQLVIREWMRQSEKLSYNTYVQIFENKGAMVGCSNSHPHCQIWASKFLPYEISLEEVNQREYFVKHNNTPMLCNYLEKELKFRDRVVEEGHHWVALVPYWAKWPFELLIIPKRHILKLKNLTDTEVEDLAVTMKKYLTRYDNKFQCSFPYSMGWHEAPNIPSSSDTPSEDLSVSQDLSHWQLHAHYYPPLLRSATVKKHIAGYELLAQVQRDLTAENAADQLRACQSDVHYTEDMIFTE